jgi:hypothetical protein
VNAGVSALQSCECVKVAFLGKRRRKLFVKTHVFDSSDWCDLAQCR